MSTAAPSQSEHVITKLGGVNATARLLGHKNASTVQGWWERGFIPGPRQREVLEAAKAASLPLSECDFIVHLQDDNAGPGPEPSPADEDEEARVAAEPHDRAPEVAA